MSEKKTKERWTFIGRRVRPSKSVYKLRHMYEDASGEAMFFSGPLGRASKRSHDVIGGVYEGDVTRKADGACTAHGTWEYQGQEAPEEKLIAWRAADLDAQTMMEEINKEKRDKSVNPLLEPLAPLRKAYFKSSSVGRRRLIAEILEYVTRHP